MDKRQNLISLMDSFNTNNGLIEFQLLAVAFIDYILSEETLDNGSKMQVAHYIENFLRKNNLQKTLKINDFNTFFNKEVLKEKLNDWETYKNLFVLIYEELSTNDKDVSECIKEIGKNLGDVLMEYFNNVPYPEEEVAVSVADVPVATIQPQVFASDFTNMKNDDGPDCFHCEEKFDCIKDDRDVQLIESLRNDTSNKNDRPMMNFDIPRNDTKIQFNNRNKTYIKEWLMRTNSIPYVCDICGLSDWQNNPLPLKLSIKDYTSTDISNYRFLCPNCYSLFGDFGENE